MRFSVYCLAFYFELIIAHFGKEGLFGGTQIETNKKEVIAWIGFNRTTDGNKIEVIVLDDQKSRELRRIRTTGLAVYLYDCTIL